MPDEEAKVVPLMQLSYHIYMNPVFEVSGGFNTVDLWVDKRGRGERERDRAWVCVCVCSFLLVVRRSLG